MEVKAISCNSVLGVKKSADAVDDVFNLSNKVSDRT